MAYELDASTVFEVREIAIVGALTTAAFFMVAGQTHLAAGAAALGVLALIARKPPVSAIGDYDVEDDKCEEVDEAKAPHYSG